MSIKNSYSMTGKHAPLCETVISECNHNTKKQFYCSSGVVSMLPSLALQYDGHVCA